MRLLTWNLNHRAARRAIPDWVSIAIGNQNPDVVVMTEYVQGDAHSGFITDLAGQGLLHTQVSTRTEGQNQILIASRSPLSLGGIQGPELHPAVPPNTLHVVVDDLQLQLIGFRMPAFASKDRKIKRAVWEWLISASRSLEPHRTVLTGDLNTAVGDSDNYCGDCLPVLPKHGWQHAIPDEGFSWKSARHRTVRRIDHTFLSPSMPSARSNYLWDFESLAPDAGSARVGIPDHAMLVVDFELTSALPQ